MKRISVLVTVVFSTMKSKSLLANFIIILALFVIMQSCSLISNKLNVTAPPNTTGDSKIPILETSKIQIPIVIPTDSINDFIKSQISSPIASGKTDELSLRLLIDEEVNVQKYVTRLLKAGVPAHYVTEEHIREVWDHVKVGVESYACALKPWKWGNCWRDVFKDVKREVKEYVQVLVPEVADQFETVAIPAIELKEAFFPTKAQINYQINFENSHIIFNGNSFNITVYSNYTIDVDITQGIKQGPLAFNQKIKGVLATAGSVVYKVDGSVTITPEGNIVLKNDNATADIKWSELSIPLAIETINFASKTDPYLIVIRKIVGDKLQEFVNNKTTQLFDKQNSKLIYKDKINKLLVKASGPFGITSDLYLVPNIEKAFVSQINGYNDTNGNNMLSSSIGLYFHPTIFYMDSVPKFQAQSDFKFAVEQINNETHLLVDSRFDYNSASQLIENEVNKLINAKYAKFGYTISSVKMYPSNDRLAIALELKSKGDPIGSVYLLSKPSYKSDTDTFSLDDVEFTLDSKKALLKIAAWFVNDKIEKFIENKAKFNVNSDHNITKIKNQIKSFKKDFEKGELNGEFEDPQIKNIYIGNEALTVYLEASGKLSLELKL